MSNTLKNNIEAIESGYEYLLAYAAQGRERDDGTEARSTLQSMRDAAAGIASALADDDDDFSEVVVEDARKSGAAIRLVLGQDRISSEIVDNLNASIHLRALLTDLFLLSETIG